MTDQPPVVPSPIVPPPVDSSPIVPPPVVPTPPVQPPVVSEPGLNERVLRMAWAQLAVYDQTATDLKWRFISRRQYVIALTMLSSIAAVIAGLMQQPVIAVFLVFVSLVLPIVATLYMQDVIQYTGATSWIRYRYVAELIRMQIYLYRMKAGDYATKSLRDTDDLLNKKVTEILQSTNVDVPRTVKEPRTTEEIDAAIAKANSYVPKDKGLTEIPVDDYVEWRIDKQREWYDDQVLKDFNLMKNYGRASQVFLAAGAVLTLVAAFTSRIEIVTLVAVTNSVSAALIGWSNVRMAGKTYGLFQIASQQLNDQKGIWLSFENNLAYSDETKRATEISSLAFRVENVLAWERKEWYEMALQAQATSDKAILGDLERLNERAKKAVNGQG